MLTKFFSPLFLLVLSLSIFANNIQQTKEIVVTATKQERQLIDVPVRTQVIDEKTIQENHAKNLAEALRHTSGVGIKQLHGKTGYGAWLQGMNSDRVLVLLDGNPILPSIGKSVDITQIASGDIKRIEVVKGAASALYGSDAMGGVINVITKEPKDGVSAKVDMSVGNWGSQSKDNNPIAKHSTILSVAQKTDNWYLQFVSNTIDQDGFDPKSDDASSEGFDGYKNNFSAKFQYKLNDKEKITISPEVYRENIKTIDSNHVPGIGYVPKDFIDNSSREGINIVYQNNKKSIFDSFKVNYLYQDYYNKSSKKVKRKLDSKIQLLATEFNNNIGEHSLTYGLEVKEEEMQVYNITNDKYEVRPEKKTDIDLFIQDSYFVTDKLEILPGLRINNNNLYGNHLSFLSSALYQIKNNDEETLNLRFGLGKGYRTPSLKELYYVFDHSSMGYMVMGDKNLVPEESNSAQISLEWLNNKYGNIDFGLFYNDITNLIDTSSSSKLWNNDPGVRVYSYQNIKEAETSGIEIIWHKKFDNLTIDFGYNYLRAINKKTGKQLALRPKNEVKLGIKYELPFNIDISAKYNYYDKQLDYDARSNKAVTTPSYSTTDIKFNQKINNKWSWYFGVDNISGTQRDFSIADWRPIQGRYSYLGFSWQI